MVNRKPPRLAFEEVAVEHLDALYRTALRYARGNTAAAEDLLQDTLVKALDAWPTLREPQRAKAWLFRILSRLHLNRLRHAARHPGRRAGRLPAFSPPGRRRWPSAPGGSHEA